MSILDTIFDAGARRRKKLADLVAAREPLQAAYSAAIESGADTDKAQAALDKQDGLIKAAQAAIDATELAAERARQASKLTDRQSAEQLALITFKDYAREASEFEQMAMAITEKWQQVQDSAEIALMAEHKAIAAGSSTRTLTGQGTSPPAMWNRVWMRVLRICHKSGRALLLFPSGAATTNHESAATVLARQVKHLESIAGRSLATPHDGTPTRGARSTLVE
jgi:hypothetical protein